MGENISIEDADRGLCKKCMLDHKKYQREFSGWFKELQSSMQQRYRFSFNLVNRYRDTFNVFVSKDDCYIIVVEPCIGWIPKMPYKVSDEMAIGNIEQLKNLDKDPNED